MFNFKQTLYYTPKLRQIGEGFFRFINLVDSSRNIND